MAVVRNIRVYTLERDSLTVTWEIDAGTSDLTEHTVTVWRSESLAGPYNPVSLMMNANDVFEFQDRAISILSKWREFYYRIRLTNSVDATYQDFGSEDPSLVLQGKDPGGIVMMEAPPDLEAMEAIRRFSLVLREYAGRRVLVLTQRTWGQRCGECWDHLKRRRTTSKCVSCFDTGLAGGFFQPMESFCMKPPHQVSVQLTPLFEMQVKDVVMWFSATPRVKPRDLIIDADGRRWRVIAVQRAEKGWALTRQTVQVREITKDQVEYDIPIRADDWGRNTMTASAMRQHIRATDIDSYNQAVSDLGLGGQTLFPDKAPIASDVEGSDGSA